jgi:hypothetical protein
MELLPASRQADLDALVMAETFEEWGWWKVVADRHDLIPLDVAEYLEIPRAVHAANVGREGDTRIRLVGLLPDCRPGSQPSLEAVLDCFGDRDATMAKIAEDRTLQRGRRLLLSAGLFHTALRMVDPDGEAWTTTGRELAARHDVASILLSGPIDRGGLQWGTLCDGWFRALGASLGRPFAVPTEALPRLPLSCIGDDAGPSLALSAAFTAVVELGPSGVMADPTPPDGVAFSAIGRDAVRSWDRFRYELLGKEPRGTPEAWRTEVARELMRFSETEEAPAEACPD